MPLSQISIKDPQELVIDTIGPYTFKLDTFTPYKIYDWVLILKSVCTFFGNDEFIKPHLERN